MDDCTQALAKKVLDESLGDSQGNAKVHDQNLTVQGSAGCNSTVQSGSEKSTPVPSQSLLDSINSSGAKFSVPTSAPSAPLTLPNNFYQPASPWSIGSTCTPTSPPFANFYPTYPTPPGQNTPHKMLSMPARFPYPPSHYTMASNTLPHNFYSPGCPLPPGTSLFPCPFPPIPAFMPMAAANSHMSNPVPQFLQRPASSSNSQHTQNTGIYTRTPMTCPPGSISRSRVTPTVTESMPSSSCNAEPSVSDKAGRKEMMSELLTRVKRVGSDEKGANCKAKKLEDGKEAKEESAAVEGQDEESNDNKQMKKSSSLTEKSEKVISEVSAENGKSNFVKKVNSGGDDLSHTSEVFPSDTDNENSELGASPMDMSDSEQRSAFEKNCYSTSGLERSMGKHTTAKGLRHRQSTTTNLTPEVIEETTAPLTVQEPSEGSMGQRIEADSGDSRPRSRSPMGAQNTTPQTHQIDSLEVTQAAQVGNNSSFDATVVLMVVLALLTAGILLNRIFLICFEPF